MNLISMIIIAILLTVIFYQQYQLVKMEEKLFRALKVTCETLDLIKKDATVDEIINLKRIK